jgi:act minimal PKS acyl carrier protein
MQVLTLDALRQLLRKSAGEAEDVDLDGDIAGIPFEELGYDSIALLETAAAIERDYGITLSDETVGKAETPGTLLALVNERMAGAA